MWAHFPNMGTFHFVSVYPLELNSTLIFRQSYSIECQVAYKKQEFCFNTIFFKGAHFTCWIHKPTVKKNIFPILLVADEGSWKAQDILINYSMFI